MEILILFHFFHFYFSAEDISLNIWLKFMKFFIDDKNIALEGTLSHFIDLGPSFYFI